MRVAVVTPYFKETEAILEQCHGSVLQQTAPCDHFLVADGFPKSAIESWKAHHITLPAAHADNGNTPRVIGAISAFNLGYEAVAFLDADNWYRSDHIERMIALQRRTGAVVCTSNRSMHRPDGSYMFVDDKNDGREHVDTSCLFMTRRVIPIMTRWAMMPRQLGPICDTVYWDSLRRQGLSRAHDTAPTVSFRTVYEADFRRLGETPPQGFKSLQVTSTPFRWAKSLSSAERRRLERELGWSSGGLYAGLSRRLKYVRLSKIVLVRAP